MELLKKYMDEVSKDLAIDDFNIKESQMRLPARKHFWVARLIDAKITLQKLQNKEKEIKQHLSKRVLEESPVKLSVQAVDELIYKNDEIKKILDQINEHKYIIEYLEKVEKVMSSLHWEIKNIVNLMQLEQT